MILSWQNDQARTRPIDFPADPHLGIKHRSRRINLDLQRQYGKQRQGHRQKDTGGHDIGQPFHEPEAAFIERRQF